MDSVPFITYVVVLIANVHKPEIMTWTHSNMKEGLEQVPLTIFTFSQRKCNRFKKKFVDTLAKLM